MIAAVIGEELGLLGIGAWCGSSGCSATPVCGSPSAPGTATASCSPPGSRRWCWSRRSINLFAVLGLAPLTGVPLPFVSYGNSSMLVMLAAVGLLLNIARGGSVGSAAKPRAAMGHCASSAASAGHGPAPRRRGAQPAVPRVVIAAGGTAGHVVPALAVADALRARGADGLVPRRRRARRGEVVPAAGYEIDLLRPARARSRPIPCRPLTPCAWRPGPCPPCAGSLRARRAEAVLGGGGYVAGPAGLAAVSLGLPLVLTEADRHLGLANRVLARRARRVCLAFPIAGRDGRPLPGHRAPGPGGDRGTPTARTARARGSGSPPPTGACSSSAAARAPAPSTPARSRRSPGPAPGDRATSTCCTSPAAATTRRPGRAGRRPGTPSATRCSTTSPGWPTRSRPATWCWRAPAARSSRSRRPAGRRSWSRIRTRRRATSTPTPTWMVDGGAAVVIEDAELEPARLRGSPAACWAMRDRLARMGAASRAARPPGCRRPGRRRADRGEPRSPRDGRADWSDRELHFIAIGGAGMSGLALVCRGSAPG